MYWDLHILVLLHVGDLTPVQVTTLNGQDMEGMWLAEPAITM